MEMEQRNIKQAPPDHWSSGSNAKMAPTFMFWHRKVALFDKSILIVDISISISIVDISTLLKNIDIDMVIFENTDIDIDKAIVKNIDIDRKSFRNIDIDNDIDEGIIKISIW